MGIQICTRITVKSAKKSFNNNFSNQVIFLVVKFWNLLFATFSSELLKVKFYLTICTNGTLSFSEHRHIHYKCNWNVEQNPSVPNFCWPFLMDKAQFTSFPSYLISQWIFPNKTLTRWIFPGTLYSQSKERKGYQEK